MANWQSIVTNFAAVDNVIVQTNGNYLIDDITVNAVNDVPEPASLAWL